MIVESKLWIISATTNIFNKISTHLFRKQRPDLWWNQGCLKALQLLLIRKLHVVGIVAIVIAFFQVKTNSILINFCSRKNFFSFVFFQLFGLIISMLLFCTIRRWVPHFCSILNQIKNVFFGFFSKRKSDTYKSYSPTSDQRQSYLDDWAT